MISKVFIMILGSIILSSSGFAGCPGKSVQGKYVFTGSECRTKYTELLVYPEIDSHTGKKIYWHKFAGDFNWGIGVYENQVDHSTQQCDDTKDSKAIWRKHGPYKQFVISYSENNAILIEGDCFWNFKKAI